MNAFTNSKKGCIELIIFKCLNAHSSAEFIGFPDWDDLLIGTGPAAPFANELLKFSQSNPRVAAFLPKRFLGRIINLGGFLSLTASSFNWQKNYGNGAALWRTFLWAA